MIRFSPRFLLSPRFFALPLLALMVIIALAQATARKPQDGVLAATKIERAVSCSAVSKSTGSSCSVASGAMLVR